MDVAGKRITHFIPVPRLMGFNPSSNGCGWKTWVMRNFLTPKKKCFNPSSNGCGWKTLTLHQALATFSRFNPSSNGCGWKTSGDAATVQLYLFVSILLLMDVAGKLNRTA